MSDDEKDAIRGSELAEDAGAAGATANDAKPDEDLAKDGIRGDGLAEEADER
jgi:hypothetical protein